MKTFSPGGSGRGSKVDGSDRQKPLRQKRRNRR